MPAALLLQHEKPCSGAIVSFSDNSSSYFSTKTCLLGLSHDEKVLLNTQNKCLN